MTGLWNEHYTESFLMLCVVLLLPVSVSEKNTIKKTKRPSYCFALTLVWGQLHHSEQHQSFVHCQVGRAECLHVKAAG